MRKVSIWRENARDCLLWAKQAQDPDEKWQWQRLAELWRLEADIRETYAVKPSERLQ